MMPVAGGSESVIVDFKSLIFWAAGGAWCTRCWPFPVGRWPWHRRPWWRLHAAPSSLRPPSRTDDVITAVCICANHQENRHSLEEGTCMWLHLKQIVIRAIMIRNTRIKGERKFFPCPTSQEAADTSVPEVVSEKQDGESTSRKHTHTKISRCW